MARTPPKTPGATGACVEAAKAEAWSGFAGRWGIVKSDRWRAAAAKARAISGFTCIVGERKATRPSNGEVVVSLARSGIAERIIDLSTMTSCDGPG